MHKTGAKYPCLFCCPRLEHFLSLLIEGKMLKYNRNICSKDYREVGEIQKKIYAAIDLKSFYASVECVERGLDPLTTNLVVADASRTEKTICLAVTPSLKAYGISGRARLFEVIQKVKEVNNKRRQNIRWAKFVGKSYLCVWIFVMKRKSLVGCLFPN